MGAQAAGSLHSLAICTGSIYLAYFLYGILQERLVKQEHGPNRERFTFTAFMLVVQCAVNAVVAFLVRLITQRAKTAPQSLFEHSKCAASYVTAMYMSNRSLNYIPYPLAVLAKSCKMIPVMLMGVLIRKQRYSTVEYLCVGAMSLGTAAFALRKIPSFSADAFSGVDTAVLIGILLNITSLVFDGTTGALQGRLSEVYPGATSLDYMMFQNAFAFLFVSVVAFFSTGFHEPLSFLAAYPQASLDLLLFSLCSAMGQIAIFYVVRHHSALACSTITTTRKFFTILFSILWFGHDLLPLQYVGIVLVFAGLGTNIYVKYARSRNTASGKKTL